MLIEKKDVCKKNRFLRAPIGLTLPRPQTTIQKSRGLPGKQQTKLLTATFVAKMNY